MSDDDIGTRLRAQLRTVKRISKDQDAWYGRHPGMTRWTQTDDVYETDPFPDGPILSTQMWTDVLEAIVGLTEACRD